MKTTAENSEKTPNFDQLGASLAILKKSGKLDFNDTESVKGYNQRAINNFLSKRKENIEFLNMLGKCELSDKAHFLFLYAVIPKYVSFIKLAGRTSRNIFQSSEEKRREKEVRNRLMEYFQFGSRDCDAALQIMSQEEVSKIVKKYDFGKVYED